MFTRPPGEPPPKPNAWQVSRPLPEDMTIYTSEGEFYVQRGDVIALVDGRVVLLVPKNA